jgi:hypothetical protein
MKITINQETGGPIFRYVYKTRNEKVWIKMHGILILTMKC